MLPLGEEVSRPLANVEEVLKWTYGNGQMWQPRSLKPRSCGIHLEPTHLVSKMTDVIPTKTPLTLVCHDMRGGYVEDRYTGGKYDIYNIPYSFYHWATVDIFVYFSHNFITIPPMGWINAAHVNGVLILGTIITEWEKGKILCHQFLESRKTMQIFVNKCVDIALAYGFDGWLINIENDIDGNFSQILQDFVKQLTSRMRQKNGNSLVLWYDSVTSDGNLDWQNELNQKNYPFFAAANGIFLNYAWKVDNLVNQLKKTVDFLTDIEETERLGDIFVGIDVFGRGCHGGGGFSSSTALREIRNFPLSVAIFAPAWTYESVEDCNPSLDLVASNAIRFWELLYPLLSLRGPKINLTDGRNPTDLKTWRCVFQTTFCSGYGSSDGKSQGNKKTFWLDISRQDIQASFFSHLLGLAMKPCDDLSSMVGVTPTLGGCGRDVISHYLPGRRLFFLACEFACDFKQSISSVKIIIRADNWNRNVKLILKTFLCSVEHRFDEVNDENLRSCKNEMGPMQLKDYVYIINISVFMKFLNKISFLGVELDGPRNPFHIASIRVSY
eukprot:maker-scaffold76_size406464-snap-gene-0.13 protein:Tk10227 transcript:maker-scaffold76_size406464-snap-gene-0.13-mRNA-1 annotation:"cytosolic endo-beta-n-acetylglucosaminidase"